MRKALLLVLSIFLLEPGFAQNLVIDKANLFSEAEEKQLLQIIGEVRRNKNGVICIYTIASLGSRSIYDYSLEVGNSLGVGQKGLNNGILLFLAPNDRKMHLQVGYGLEWAVPDDVSGTVISALTPYYRKQQYLEGTLAGIGLLQEKLGRAYVSVNDVSWDEVLTSPGLFAGRVVRFRYPGSLKSGNCFQPKPEHV